MTAFINHFSFEFRSGIRNKQLLMMNYLFPLGFYLLMGFIMTGINPLFLSDIIPAMIVFGVLAASLLGIPEPLVNARENGIFRSYKINGVPSFSILIIPILTTTLHMIILAAIISITAPLLFKAPLPTNWLSFIGIFFAFAFASTSISVLIGIVSPNSRSTILWAQLIFVPSMILGGLMLPFHMLPAAAANLAQLLPATHAMNSFRGLAMGNGADFSPWASVAALLASGFLSLFLAYFLFSWDNRNSSRRASPLLAFLALLPYALTIILLLP